MTAAPDPPPLLDAALSWAMAGVSVLPAAPDGSKRPALDWKQYQHQRADIVDLTTWLGGTPDYEGIGIVCGQVSGNLEMFELEAAAVTDGLHTELRDLFHTAGFPDLWDKLQTYVELSPAGGLHWIYRVAGTVPGNTKLARRRALAPDGVSNGIQVLMETRGEGGWVVVSPSAGRTHPTGKAWRLLPGSQPGVVPTLTADEHQTLHRLAATFDQLDAIPAPVEPPTITRRPGETTPGDAYNQGTDWADILVPAGWARIGHRGTTTFWRRPGKNVGISATTGYGDQGLDLFYVFTTSTEFDSERSYSKLGAYAVLHHHGDYAKAAGELRRAGYGDPLPEPERTNPLTLIHGGGGDAQMPNAAPVAAQDGPGALPAEAPPSWGRVDLSEFLDGSFVPQVPELMVRTDGRHLLYRGRVHSFHGESESGKSWVALAVAAVELTAGETVLMVDFESDPHTTVGRLLRMGVPAEAIRDRFDYRRPELSPNGLAREFQAWTELLGNRYVLAILDGVTEALAIYGVTSKDNDEVTKWIRSTPRRLAASTGAAVVLVDHVTKDADSRGRFAIGGQAKMAALDGAAYVMEVLEPLGVGLAGRVAMRVAKDRPGGVRPHSGTFRKSDRTQESAVVVIDSVVTDRTTVRVEGPRLGAVDDEGGTKPWRPTHYMERVSRALEHANAAMSRNGLTKAIAAKKDMVLQAIDYLIDDGYAAADGPTLNGHPSIRLLKPYREDDGLVPGPDPAELVRNPPERLVPGSRSNDRGTSGTSPTASDRFPGTSGNQSGTSPQIPFDEGGEDR